MNRVELSTTRRRCCCGYGATPSTPRLLLFRRPVLFFFFLFFFFLFFFIWILFRCVYFHPPDGSSKHPTNPIPIRYHISRPYLKWLKSSRVAKERCKFPTSIQSLSIADWSDCIRLNFEIVQWIWTADFNERNWLEMTGPTRCSFKIPSIIID